MKNVYAQRSANITKTWLLIFFMAILVIGLGFFVSQVYGEPFILYIAIGLSIVLNISSYWFSDKVALAMHHARPADPTTDRELINLIEELAITAGLPAPRVYVIQDPAPNAFATGRNEKHAVIAVTTGLMSRLNRVELQGVLAHEMAHIGNRDILLSTVIVILVGFVSIIADIFLRSMAFGGGRSNDRGGNANAFLMIFGVILLVLSPIVATLIQLAVSRRREYLADATAALLTRYPEGLASALLKIEETHLPMRTVHQSTAHLFFADPVAADTGKERRGEEHEHVPAPKGFSARLAGLFSTHPPIAERVKRLREIA